MSRVDSLNSWHDDWRGLKVAVLGLGVTGFSVADTLAELGCELLVLAERADAEQLDILDVIGVRGGGESDHDFPSAKIASMAREVLWMRTSGQCL